MQATRRTLLAGLGASLALTALSHPASAHPASAHPASDETNAPEWGAMDLLDADGRSFRLDQAAQPFTLVTLWAHWCAVCLRELDTVGAITPAIGPDTIRVILLSHPDDWDRNQTIARRRGLSLPCARISPNNAPSLLQRALLSADGTFYVPRTILFSRDRRAVVWSHVGGLDWRRPDVIGRLRHRAA